MCCFAWLFFLFCLYYLHRGFVGLRHNYATYARVPSVDSSPAQKVGPALRLLLLTSQRREALLDAASRGPELGQHII